MMDGLASFPRTDVVCGDVMVNSSDGLKHAALLVADLEHILFATEDLIGRDLRRELFQAVSIEDVLRLSKRRANVKRPVLVGMRPFYVSTGDPDDDGVSASIMLGERLALRQDAGDRRVEFRTYMHEVGHGLYAATDASHILAFSKVYYGLRARVIDKIVRGKQPVDAANDVFSERAFLSKWVPEEAGFICWRGFVGEDSVPSESDLRRYFHGRKVPVVDDARRLFHSPEEAFCEAFAHYFRLERGKKGYRILPDERFAKHKQLYAFCQDRMKDVIGSAGPEARSSRSIL